MREQSSPVDKRVHSNVRQVRNRNHFPALPLGAGAVRLRVPHLHGGREMSMRRWNLWRRVTRQRKGSRTLGAGSGPGSGERKPCCGEVSAERNVSRTGMRVRCGAQHYPGRSSVGSNRAVASHLPGQEKGRRCEMSWSDTGLRGGLVRRS